VPRNERSKGKPRPGEGAQVTPLPQTLPRGRHSLSRATVQASQRGRLLEAVLAATADRGFVAVTITDIVQRAGVARRTFYENFADKEEAFLAAFEYAAEEVIAAVAGAFRPEDETLQARVEGYISALLTALDARPAEARAFIVEIGTGGPAAIALQLDVNERLAKTIVELNRQTRLRDPFVPPISAARALAIVGAIEELIRHAIHEQGPESICGLRGELVSLTSALLTAPPSDETREAA
jgi:AcrR family transcriptional regulator